jgi:general secretion pathway protein F
MTRQTFRYKAVDRARKIHRGEIEATSVTAVVQHLREKDLEAVAIVPVGARNLAHRKTATALTRQELSFFLRQFASLARAGLRPLSALDMLQTLSTSDRMKAELERIAEGLTGGRALSETLAAAPQTYPRFVTSLAAAGETAGNLNVTLGRAADILDRTIAIRRKLISALIYPAILCVASVASAFIILLGVIPRFEAMFKDAGVELPFLTRVLIGASDILLTSGPFLATGGLLLALLLRSWIGRDTGRLAFDGWIIRVRLIGSTLKNADLARFCYAMNALLVGGVSVSSALAAASNVITNRAIAASVEGVRESLHQGNTLASALRKTNIFPPLMVQVIGVGADSGTLDTSFLEMNRFFDEELERRLAHLLSLVSPVITLLMGGMVAAIIASVMMAVLKINDLALQ